MSTQAALGPAAALALAAVCTAARAACGSSVATSGAASRSSNEELAASECMRAHGVTNFPDPRKGAGGEGLTVLFSPNSSAVTIGGITFSGPAFEAAEKACSFFGPAGGNPPVPEQQKRALLAFAKCMRQHGLTAYADPQFPPGGGIFGGGNDGRYDQNSPAVKRAASICNQAMRSDGGG